MVVKTKKPPQRGVRRNSRHVRWNWEMSEDATGDTSSDRDSVRYHFVIVDDKNREGILAKIEGDLQRCGNIVYARRKEGKVRNSELRYLFVSFDSVVAPKMIRWKRVKRPVKPDDNLVERKKGNIETYVSNLYE